MAFGADYLLKNYAHRITVYKKDGKTIKREVAEYDQLEKRWRTS